MTFWSDYKIDGDDKDFEPKRKFTFLLNIVPNSAPTAGGLVRTGEAEGTIALESYLVKKVKKPEFEVTESPHQYLNYEFYYPGRVKWKEVSFTIVDVIAPNTARKFLELLNKCGYKAPIVPGEANEASSATVSKLKSIEALGVPTIHQIDSNGAVVESWKLHGAWVKNVNFGELDYSSDDLMNIDVTLRYDFAECQFGAEGSVSYPVPNG